MWGSHFLEEVAAVAGLQSLSYSFYKGLTSRYTLILYTGYMSALLALELGVVGLCASTHMPPLHVVTVGESLQHHLSLIMIERRTLMSFSPWQHK